MDRVYTKNDRILRKDLDEGPALIDPYRRTVVLLDPVGEEIWRLLDGTRTVADIAGEIKAAFEVSGEPVERDVMDFISDLATREMVVSRP